jgi:hypothetical protein
MMSSSISHTSSKLACLWAHFSNFRSISDRFRVDFGLQSELRISKIPFCALLDFQSDGSGASETLDGL